MSPESYAAPSAAYQATVLQRYVCCFPCTPAVNPLVISRIFTEPQTVMYVFVSLAASPVTPACRLASTSFSVQLSWSC